ncbi:DED1 [Symbiodinium sp. CCMP2592]|nr:DED1 [Symbiodinium sp. CCMP2592]
MAKPELALVAVAEPEPALDHEKAELEHRKQVRVKLLGRLRNDRKLKTMVIQKKRFILDCGSKSCQGDVKINMAVLKHVAVAWAKHRYILTCPRIKRILQKVAWKDWRADVSEDQIQNDAAAIKRLLLFFKRALHCSFKVSEASFAVGSI